MNHDDVVIVAAARTPQGRLKGQLAPLTAVQLGSIAIRGALEQGGIPADAVDAVLVGQVLPAGAGQNPARQAAVGAGIPWAVHSGIGQQGVPVGSHRDHRRRAHDRRRRREGRRRRRHGVDDPRRRTCSMGSRDGWTYGSVEVLDHMAYDGLTDAYDRESMGASTERHNDRFEITREMQDAVAARSHQRAAAAQPRRASSTPRSCRSRSRSARATRSS